MRHEQGEGPDPTSRISATRRRIVDATYEVIVSGGRPTAGAIAARAKVSRRTFFNYFPSVDAAVNAPVEAFLDAAVTHLAAGDPGTPMLDAMVAALDAATRDEPLERLAACAALQQASPALRATATDRWDAATDRLARSFLERLDIEPFVARSMAGALMGCGRAAFDEWQSQRTPEGASAPVEVLSELLTRALTYVAAGFASALPQSGAGPAGDGAPTADTPLEHAYRGWTQRDSVGYMREMHVQVQEGQDLPTEEPSPPNLSPPHH